jgi:hypothetical protein
MAKETCCFKGRGKIWIQPYGKNSVPRRFLGNCSQLQYTPKLETESVPDYTHAGGGVDCSSTRISEVTVAIKMRCMSPQNLALALLGSAQSVATGNVVDEEAIAFKGSLTALAKAMPSSVNVTDMAGTVTYQTPRDYVPSGAGLFIPDTTTIPAPVITNEVAAPNVKVDYAYGAQYLIQALTKTSDEYSMLFDGLNDVDGFPVIVKFHRLKFGPSKALELLGDKMAEIDVDTAALTDSNIVAAGLSRYLEVAIGLAA